MTWPIEDQLSYTNGVINDERGRRAVIEILSVFPALQEHAEDIQGPVAGRLMYEAERKNAIRAVNVLIMNSVIARVLQRFSYGRKILSRKAAEITTKQGFCDMTVERFPQNNTTGKVICRNTFESTYRRPADHPVCNFMAGAIAGAASAIYEGEFHVKETACEATGDDACVFTVEPK